MQCVKAENCTVINGTKCITDETKCSPYYVARDDGEGFYKCVTSCPEGLSYVETTNQCVDKCQNHFYVEEGGIKKCLTIPEAQNCTTYTTSFIEGQDRKDSNLYCNNCTQDQVGSNNCYSVCTEKNYYYDIKSGKCIYYTECQAPKYYDGKFCVDNCSTEAVNNITRICTNNYEDPKMCPNYFKNITSDGGKTYMIICVDYCS